MGEASGKLSTRRPSRACATHASSLSSRCLVGVLSLTPSRQSLFMWKTCLSLFVLWQQIATYTMSPMWATICSVSPGLGETNGLQTAKATRTVLSFVNGYDDAITCSKWNEHFRHIECEPSDLWSKCTSLWMEDTCSCRNANHF